MAFDLAFMLFKRAQLNTKLKKLKHENMELILKTIGDYYPLGFDLAESNLTSQNSSGDYMLGVDDLLNWASENNLSEIQTMTLLVKNAFEGHNCHLNKIPIESIIERGTLKINLSEDAPYEDLVVKFFVDFHLYEKGLSIAWKKLTAKNIDLVLIDFQSLLYFILANQLFRLPVSLLKEYKSEAFSIASVDQRDQLKFYFHFNVGLQNFISKQTFIDLVNEKYQEKFKDLLLSLQSKENVMMQLFTKLDFANDPSVKSEEDLEKKYFEFIVAKDVSRSDRREITLSPEISETTNEQNFSKLIKTQIKKIYKTLSKNCSEVHTQTTENEGYSLLRQLFIEATSIYDRNAKNTSSLFVQKSSLIQIFIKIINYRIINKLPVNFDDYSGIGDKQDIKLSEEDVARYHNNLQSKLAINQLMQLTNFKVKYINDKEMAKIHRDYLERQLQFVEDKISEIVKEIKSVMQNKTRIA
jgi:hypothetical protein